MQLLRFRLIGPGVDAAEFVDIGVTQVSQSRGCGLATVSTAAVDQNRGVRFRDHFGGSIFINGTYWQLNSTRNVAAVVLVLLPYIQNDDLLRIHHLLSLIHI